MDNYHIAHDLAVAKLYGSDLPVDKLCEKYDQYLNEILEYLNRKPKEAKTAKAINISI